MKYTGIHFHKRYCVCAKQEQGGLPGKQRISGNSASGVVQIFESLGGPCRVGIEA